MKVTVVLLTYNHELFIEQALQGVLMQETRFPYEVVIVEDCSTDRTREIVVAYQQQYPDRIRLHLNPTNENSKRAWGHAIETAQGAYVALLDGDDYWTSPAKLQKQADFLDHHAECALCFHNVRAFFEDGSAADYLFNEADQQPFSVRDDLWHGNFIAGCSPMLRKKLVSPLPSWFNDLQWGDWPLYILCTQHGSIGYLNEVMGAYRIHRGGMWSGADELEQTEAVLQFYLQMNHLLNYEHNQVLTPLIAQCYFGLALQYEQRGDLGRMRTYLHECLSSRPLNAGLPAGEVLRMLAKIHLPAVYQSVKNLAKAVR
jgi:glycosyltransferase involved in cell wall biosynthesis